MIATLATATPEAEAVEADTILARDLLVLANGWYARATSVVRIGDTITVTADTTRDGVQVYTFGPDTLVVLHLTHNEDDRDGRNLYCDCGEWQRELTREDVDTRDYWRDLI